MRGSKCNLMANKVLGIKYLNLKGINLRAVLAAQGANT